MIQAQFRRNHIPHVQMWWNHILVHRCRKNFVTSIFDSSWKGQKNNRNGFFDIELWLTFAQNASRQFCDNKILNWAHFYSLHQNNFLVYFNLCQITFNQAIFPAHFVNLNNCSQYSWVIVKPGFLLFIKTLLNTNFELSAMCLNFR